MDERDLIIKELEEKNKALSLEISEKDSYAERLEQNLLAKCKNKEAMKVKIEKKKAEFGLKH